MSDIFSIIILFLIGAVAAFINVNAGGGSSLTLPALIFLGLDSATANGTNRIAVLMQNVSAVYSFKKEKYHHFSLSWKLSFWTLPGSVLGALIAVKIDDELFHKILAVIMIGIIMSMFIPVKKSGGAKEEKITIPVILSMVFTGFYGGFIQVGIGFIIMAALNKLMNMNLILVNMHKVFIVFILTVPALLIFILTDNVNWYWGITLALGNFTGGWWAAKFSVRKGEKLIKAVLAAAIFIIALELLDVF